MAVSPIPERKATTMTMPPSDSAARKPPLCGVVVSSSSTASFAGRIDSATTAPTASGTIATISGSEPVTPTPPRTNGPMNWQVA